jgi:hypothetical protein
MEGLGVLRKAMAALTRGFTGVIGRPPETRADFIGEGLCDAVLILVLFGIIEATKVAASAMLGVMGRWRGSTAQPKAIASYLSCCEPLRVLITAFDVIFYMGLIYLVGSAFIEAVLMLRQRWRSRTGEIMPQPES